MEDCIEFQGYKDKNGYGRKRSVGKVRFAHRIAYCKAKNIDIKDIDGLFVMHACDNPSCVNPQHLRLGTHQDNMDDRNNKKRQAKGLANAGAKLTESQVLEIRLLVKFKSQTEVARLFSINQSQVSLIARRKQWAHLPEQPSIDGGEK
jgi:hypothetical protein